MVPKDGGNQFHGSLFAGITGQNGWWQASNVTPELKARANRVILDLELKRVPARPEFIGDAFDGRSPGVLEERVLEVVHRHGMLERTVVRSFDHRTVRRMCQQEPSLVGVVLVEGTAPADPAAVTRAAGARIYGPDFRFLDGELRPRAAAKR